MTIEHKMSIDRRKLLQTSVVALGSVGLGLPVCAARYRTIPQRPNCRVIVDNDFAGDPDALIGLAHQLLSPKSVIPLITVSALDPKLSGGVPTGTSVAKGVQVAQDLLARIGTPSAASIKIAAGAETFDTVVARQSNAAQAIVAEAMRNDPLPLYITCGGPLTNVAAALRIEPAIAGRMTVIWIGGGDYPLGSWEYNLATDMDAARHVIERTKVPLWQVPQGTYRQMQVSVAELQLRLRSASPFGEWLYEKFTSPPDFVDLGGTWPMGDSPPVIFTAISRESGTRTTRKARRIRDDHSYGEEIDDREIVIVETVDVRLTMEDFFAKLNLAVSR